MNGTFRSFVTFGSFESFGSFVLVPFFVRSVRLQANENENGTIERERKGTTRTFRTFRTPRTI